VIGSTFKIGGESHKDLAITEPEWQAFLHDFQTTLDKFRPQSKRSYSPLLRVRRVIS